MSETLPGQVEATHSVTHLIAKLQSENRKEFDEAARGIWSKYSLRLLTLAREHLSARVRRREDEDDVLQNVYKSFCQRHKRGDFRISDRNDLWRLLVAITENKVRSTATRHTRGRRDVRKEVTQESSGSGAGRNEIGLLQGVKGHEPTPGQAIILVEELTQRLSKLDDTLRQVALWKLEGYTDREIAVKMKCVVRTVERKLSRIRSEWEPDAASVVVAE